MVTKHLSLIFFIFEIHKSQKNNERGFGFIGFDGLVVFVLSRTTVVTPESGVWGFSQVGSEIVYYTLFSCFS